MAPPPTVRARRILVLAGPNGAGKTTASRELLPSLGFRAFVNADDIARTLPDTEGASTAFAAGRLALARLDMLAEKGEDFAVETTLAGLTLANWLAGQRGLGAEVILVYLWLPNADAAVQRVARRVEAGGHSIPEPVIRRRYVRGLRNLCVLYLPLADRWTIYDNHRGKLRMIAVGTNLHIEGIHDGEAWERIQQYGEST